MFLTISFPVVIVKYKAPIVSFYPQGYILEEIGKKELKNHS